VGSDPEDARRVSELGRDPLERVGAAVEEEIGEQGQPDGDECDEVVCGDRAPAAVLSLGCPAERGFGRMHRSECGPSQESLSVCLLSLFSLHLCIL
jgi:hypothetical protein